MPLHIEALYDDYNFTGAFAVASLLAFLALVTLGLKTWVEHKNQELDEPNPQMSQIPQIK
jgi:sulfate transport system permease protein